MEDTEPHYVYIILRGEIALFKKLENLYNKKGKRIKVEDIPIWSDLQNVSNKNYGS